MREIILSKGLKALVDDEDYDWLSQWKWCAAIHHKNAYAVRSFTDSKKRSVRMHRVILALTDPKIQVDHIDGDGLNNQRNNLRICTQGENMRNVAPRTGYTSKYKGVLWFTDLGRWKAQISVNTVVHYLGSFETEQEAALAYNNAASIHHGEFAYLNIIDWEQSSSRIVKPKKQKSSRYKGVHKDKNSWVAAYKGARLGSFSSEDDAHKAYIEACKIYGYPKQDLKYLNE